MRSHMCMQFSILFSLEIYITPNDPQFRTLSSHNSACRHILHVSLSRSPATRRPVAGRGVWQARSRQQDHPLNSGIHLRVLVNVTASPCLLFPIFPFLPTLKHGQMSTRSTNAEKRVLYKNRRNPRPTSCAEIVLISIIFLFLCSIFRVYAFTFRAMPLSISCSRETTLSLMLR